MGLENSLFRDEKGRGAKVSLFPIPTSNHKVIQTGGISKVRRLGYNTLPLSTVVAISVVGVALIWATAATVMLSIAITAAIARRGAIPALVHGIGEVICR